ncbi:hypothetical protein FSP39_011671 [Pinctada imbricata]|uniref:28S ribosomal protein S30, mitochondrial n=1 Tax=Pinctada imbricata TaxID=66713 RepID=A0AA88Y4E5_PINIB|nr:hypothetical protein FSP39_011671 [Pinctada imbricata]
MAASMVVGRKLLKLSSTLVFRAQEARLLSSQVSVQEDVKYPPIRGKYPPGEWPKNEEDMHPDVCWEWYDKGQEFRSLPTIQERLDHMESTYFDKDYGVHTYVYPSLNLSPNSLEFQQFVTKTALIEGMPNVYNLLDVQKDIDYLTPLLKEKIVMNTTLMRRDKNNFISKRETSHEFIKDIMMMVITCMGGKYRHLVESSLNEQVDIHAHWNRYKVERLLPQEKRYQTYWSPDKITIKPSHSQYNHCFLSQGKADLLLRTELPLPEFVSMNDELSTKEYPPFDYFPNQHRTRRQWKKLKVSPGHNFGDPNSFGYLAVLNSNDDKWLTNTRSYPRGVVHNMKRGWGMNNMFLWTVAQAHYQGFNSYNNITYPFTSQGIITDGKRYTFMAYQLNTLHLWKDDAAEPLVNLCWHKDNQKLYDTVEDGEVKGFNEEVCAQLLKFFLIRPAERGYDLRPTLPEDSTDRIKKNAWIEDKVEIVEEVEEIVFDES